MIQLFAVLWMLLFPHQVIPSTLSELDQFGCTALQSLRQNSAGTNEECFAGGAAGTNAWTIVKKTADEPLTNDNSVNQDSQLFFTIAADTRVMVRAIAWYSTTENADFQSEWDTTPAGADFDFGTEDWTSPGNDTQTASTTDVGYTRQPNIAAGTGCTTQTITFSGGATEYGRTGCFLYFNNNATPRTFRLLWAQNTSHPDTTTVHRGSYIEHRVLCTSC
jgi:hypothetical protein